MLEVAAPAVVEGIPAGPAVVTPPPLTASILPPPDVPVVPIPNLAPHLHCSGEPHRAIRTTGTSFTGTGVTNSAYFRHHSSGILEMKTGVSFLDLKAKIRNVPCGRYEATILLKCDTVSSFEAYFSMSKQKQRQAIHQQWKQYHPFARFTSHYANDVGGRFLSSHQGQWIRLSFGLVDIPISSTDVMFRIFGENSWWSRGLWFHDLELRRVRLEWEKERMLLLAYYRRAGCDCPLQDLPKEVVRAIACWII